MYFCETSLGNVIKQASLVSFITFPKQVLLKSMFK